MNCLNGSNTMAICLFVMLFFNKTILSSVLNGTYFFCNESNNLKLVNYIDNCPNKTSNDLESIINDTIVFTEIRYQINGVGYQCQYEYGVYQKVSDFYSLPYDVKYRNLTRNQCEFMIKSKSCHGNEMKCIGNTCNYKKIRIIDDENKYFGYQCSYKEVYIQHENINAPLFASGCNAQAYSCNLHDSIIIWNRSIVNTYPYAWTNIYEMNQYQISNETIFYDEKNYLLFKLTGRTVNVSDLILHETTNGLFVVIDDPDENNVETVTKVARFFNRHDYLADINYMTKLMKAETDAYIFKNDLRLMSMNHELCMNRVKQHISEIPLEDGFLIRQTKEYGYTIIYSNNGEFFIPECQIVKTIEVPNQIEECYNDLQIRVLFSNNTKVNAFLTKHNNIIRKQSTYINCSLNRHYQTNGRHIIRRNKFITIKNVGNQTSINLRYDDLHLNITLYKFHHNEFDIEQDEISDSSIKELDYQINVILILILIIILIFVLYCIKSCFVKKNNTF